VLGKHLQHAYFALRVDCLTIVSVSTAFWVAGGWDSTVESTIFGPRLYGDGIHWSTVQTFFLAVYVLALNLHVGGLDSFSQLGREIKRDFISIGREFVILFDLVRSRSFARKEWRDLRNGYKDYANVDPVRGAGFAILFSFAATYLFEDIWVPLYDYFQFHSIMWPVYCDGTCNPLLNLIFLRNVVACGFALGIGAVMLYLVFDGEPNLNLRQRFSVKWRFGWKWGAILTATIGGWVLWIYFPHAVLTEVQLSASQVLALHTPVSEAFLNSTSWIFPAQGLFPQTEYTFYQAIYALRPYPDAQVFGFYLNEPALHAVNIGVKYLMYATVCYPAMLKVRFRG
jgi:hypothetical protein